MRINFRNYFGQRARYFWEWQDHMSIISLRRGNTIVYTEYLCDLLEDLQYEQWPPLGAVLMVTMACGNKAQESILQLHDFILNDFFESEQIEEIYTGEARVKFLAGWEFLKRLSQVAVEYTPGPDRRILIRHVFQQYQSQHLYHWYGKSERARWMRRVRRMYKTSRAALVRLFVVEEPEAHRKFIGDFAYLAIRFEKHLQVCHQCSSGAGFVLYYR